METALGTVLRRDGDREGKRRVTFTVAGRTDAGVHARGQVAHVDVPDAPCRQRPPTGSADGPGLLVRRPLALLGPRDPRPAAQRRTARRRPGLPGRARTGRVRRPVLRTGPPLRLPDRGRSLRPAASPRHAVLAPAARRRRDARGGRRPARASTTSPRSAGPGRGRRPCGGCCGFDWTRDADGVLTAWVDADAFCHSMVRSLVGAGLAVGEGRRPAGWPAEVLRARRARLVGACGPCPRTDSARCRLPAGRRAGGAGRRDPPGAGARPVGRTLTPQRMADGPRRGPWPFAASGQGIGYEYRPVGSRFRVS